MKFKNKGIAFIAGVVAGGVVGSVTALLFAPKSGKELRGDIKENADKVIEAGSEVIDQVSETVFEASKKLEDGATKALQHAKQGVQSIVSSVKQRCKADESEQANGKQHDGGLEQASQPDSEQAEQYQQFVHTTLIEQDKHTGAAADRIS